MVCRNHHTCITVIRFSAIYFNNRSEKIFSWKSQMSRMILEILEFCSIYSHLYRQYSLLIILLAPILHLSHTAKYNDNILGLRFQGCLDSCLIIFHGHSLLVFKIQLKYRSKFWQKLIWWSIKTGFKSDRELQKSHNSKRFEKDSLWWQKVELSIANVKCFIEKTVFGTDDCFYWIPPQTIQGWWIAFGPYIITINHSWTTKYIWKFQSGTWFTGLLKDISEVIPVEDMKCLQDINAVL